ncbi:MAG: hypothetical protein HY836_06785 [Aquabacterium sp.]|uniref:hypothetical protein n=1 Tax=Aquabacterium sp. TaxID=1872578 RepID=UPI0025BF4E61|nr:hypothetical protein [Aquabacterium sp.]MBI5925289.1 hypothetical protein [Aquabacterium sp.]
MINRFIGMAALSLIFASTAKAETETWHLEGIIYRVTESATNIPDGLQIDQSFTVDYIIDGDAPFDGYVIHTAVQQITINGNSTLANGHIARAGLGLNVTPMDAIFGLTFVSFNALNLARTPTPSTPISAHELLTQYALSPSTNSGDIRFDFNGGGHPSVWGHVNSFAQTVPEPSKGLLGALGLVGLLTTVRRHKAT